jgi:hypothetical protein
LYLQAGLDEVPAHDALGVGPGGAVAPEYLWTDGAGTAQQHGGCTVGEEAGRDQVALGAVAALEGEARELDPDEENGLVRVQPGILGGAGETRGAGGAT